MRCKTLLLITALLLIPGAMATTYTEDFESYNTVGIIKPTIGQSWYTYKDPYSIANVVTTAPILQGLQSLRAISNSSLTSGQYVAFDVKTANQLSTITFIITGSTLTDSPSTLGSKQYVNIGSSAPVRSLAQFFVFCSNDSGNPANNDACQLSVRWQEVDSTGQVLIPYSSLTKVFNITMTITWTSLSYDLTVNGVDDGIFSFYLIPQDFQELTLNQYQSDIPMIATFDWWHLTGAANTTSSVVDGDVAQGIQGFATDMNFSTTTSLFIFGIIVFVILNAALIVAMFSHGKNNTIAPAASLFTVLAGFWMIEMKFWPDWINIVIIIYVSSMSGLALRRVMLGVRNVGSSGPSMVIGSLGYFVICGVFLSLAGYSVAQVSIPGGSVEESAATSQSFGGAVVECIVTLFGDCNQNTQSALWKTITDIYGWIIASVQYLFQLMTFQLPIPVTLNMIIVLPPAASLGAYAIQLIRG